MHPDVLDLQRFYAESLGKLAQRHIRQRIRSFWPDLSGQSLLSLGYPLPYMRPFLGEAERLALCLPAQQGATYWPAEGRNLVTLVEETALPFEDASVDRILMIHSLEVSSRQKDLLQEVWRILKGNGRALIIVPNRRGVWARFDHTPFGSGVPFSVGQMHPLLRACQLRPEREGYALFPPPVRRRMAMRATPAWESLGQRFFPVFGGVVLVEASKQVFAPTAPGRAQARHPLRIIPSPVGLQKARKGLMEG